MTVTCTVNCETPDTETDVLAKFIANGIPEIQKILEEYGKANPIRLTVSMGM